MTRLLTCGWETGDVNETLSVPGSSAAQAVVNTSPAPRTPGQYCFKIGMAAGSTGWRTWTLAAPVADIWIRLAFLAHVGGETPVIGLLDSAGNVTGLLSWSGGDNLLRVYRGTTGNVLLATSSVTYPPDQWHTIDLRWQITSATVGAVEVWVDDNRWLNLVGVDNTLGSSLYVYGVQLVGSTNFFGATTYLAFDDFAINDTNGLTNNSRIGDGRVVLLRPNGAGSSTDLSRGGTNTGANWSQTSETPPSMTQFAYDSVVGHRDLYALADLPAGSWTINTVEALLYGQASDPGAASLGPTIKSGATTAEGSPLLLPTSPIYMRTQWETNPDTTAGWTPTTVNALELGVTVR